MQIFVSKEVNSPFKKIGEAAKIARPGDEVVIAPGVYREYVNPERGGTDGEHRITYKAEIPGTVTVTGSEAVHSWEYAGGDLWRAEIPNGLFGDYNPYTTVIYGDWYRGMGRINHTGQVYLNGRALYEVDKYSDLTCNEPLRWSWDQDYSRMNKWYTEQSGGNTVIYARFGQCDPNKEMTEINVRRQVFFPAATGINYICLKGLVLTCAATQWAPPTAFQDGLVGPHWSKGWLIEECEIANSRCAGISLGKCLFPSNNRWTEDKIKDGAQLERDTVLYAQHTGWSKETVGSHTIRGCHIHDCGQAGIVGHLGGAFSLIEDNEVDDINNYGEFSGSELAGIKLHGAIDTVIRRNHIHHCHRGMWLDWQAQGTRVTKNLFHDNSHDEDTRISEDLYIEVSHGPTLIDNNFFLSQFPLRERSQGMAFVHNMIAGPIDIGSSGGRFTPYHFPHETDVMGFMTINGGDNRFYNNIFIQPDIPKEKTLVPEPEFAGLVGVEPVINIEAGLHIYNDYPTEEEYYKQFDDENAPISPWGHQYDYNSPLPMFISGNAYFNGARPYAKEKDAYLCRETITYRLRKEKDHYYLDTDLYSYLPALRTELITSAVLGKVFEPEERYENPNGAEIKIDEDYLGRERYLHPTAGPLESGEETGLPLI